MMEMVEWIMTDALSIALSGLTAQKQKLAASASNIANVSTSGALPTATGAASAVYKPLQVNFISESGGGVRADVVERKDAYTAAYDPSSPHADAEGMIAVPNVDLVEESVKITETKVSFRANLGVMKTQDEMLGELLDTLA